jgi:hypothetical protein
MSAMKLAAPVPLSLHGPTALSLLGLAFALMGGFVVAESSASKSIVFSLLLALLSSAAMGLGVVFLFLWLGIFV